MFGFKSTPTKISGASARLIREKMARIQTNSLNEKEKEEIEKIKAATKKYHVVWE